LRQRPLDAKALKHVLDLYEGDFLAGDDSELWIIDYRQRLRGLYLQAARELLAQATERAELDQAMACLERGHALDPLDEHGAESLMNGYLKLGYPSKAMEVFHSIETSLRRELGIRPGTALTGLAQRLRQAV
jgi:pentatricopeptide repeat protein